MPPHPTISVAMCTCNGERFIREQLDSIADQTIKPSELIVCDDRSTDATPRIIESFSATVGFPVRLIINDQRLGVARNFESALRRCVGEILCLADQDDRWHLQKLSRISSAFSTHPDLDFLFTDAGLIDETANRLPGTLWQRARFVPPKTPDNPNLALFHRLLQSPVATGATVAISSRLRDRVLPISPDWIHDEWIALLASAGAGNVAWINEPLIDYRIHATQAVGVGPTGLVEDVRAVQSRPDPFTRLEIQFKQIHDFATERLSSQIAADKARLLLDKSTSAGRRARLAKIGRISRLREIRGMLARGEYRQFWLGWKSALRDLMF